MLHFSVMCWWFIIHIFQQCHVIYLILWFFHYMQIYFKCALSLWQLWSFNIWDIENRIFKCICTLCYVVVIHYSHFSAVYELCHVIYLVLWFFHCMQIFIANDTCVSMYLIICKYLLLFCFKSNWAKKYIIKLWENKKLPPVEKTSFLRAW